jgi:hypothetical protein
MLKRLLLILICALAICIWFSSCSYRESESEESDEKNSVYDSLEEYQKTESVFLEQTQDAGKEYIDSFIFLGESTTYHLKSRGVLSGGQQTTQVWAPPSGTLMLDRATCRAKIIFPETSEELEISEALRIKNPKYMLLTFGLNGAPKTVKNGDEYFKSCYKSLISTIRATSPDTVIILQSCFPVAKNMDMSAYSIDAKTLNSYIDRINLWTCELAKELDLGYLNTAEILKDDDGFLMDGYQIGDGYHLNATAYKNILYYIRTHAYAEESK